MLFPVRGSSDQPEQTMLILLSPAKRLNTLQKSVKLQGGSMPEYFNEANILASMMKQYSPRQLEKRLNINPQIALTAATYFAAWQEDPLPLSLIPALLAFNGDAYRGLNALTLSEEARQYATEHLRILSAMYGMLRPFDLIQPYRLDMENPVKPEGSKNLTEFWKDKITQSIQNHLKKSGSDILVNLASEEYFKAVDTEKLDARIIQPVFRELRDGTYKTMSMYLKFARGRMTRFILENNLKDPEDIKTFDWEGYEYHEQLSDETHWVFTR